MRSAATLTVIGALALGAGTRQPMAQTTQEAVVAFAGARIVRLDGTPGVFDATILVRDGRVTELGPPASIAVPAGARQINLGGRFVLPGLISTHVHVSDVAGPDARAYTDENTLRQLGVFARYGITTVASLGGEQAPAFRAREAQQTWPAGSPRRARIAASGTIITAATPEAAREQVTKVAAQKPDVIKIRVDDNLGTARKMPPDVFNAVIDEAHRLGLRVAAHVFYLDDAKALLRSGVDMIAHSVRDRDIDDEFIALMKARNIPYCPTLTRELSTFVYESTPAFFADPFFLAEADPAMVARLREPARQQAMAQSKSAQAYKAALVVAQRNLKKASDAGLLVVMGTDSGAFPERFQGYFEHVEMTMMAVAGMTPVRVLRSATVDAARALRLSDVGALVPGAWADFIVLDRNPLEDIRNTRSIVSVFVAGASVPGKPGSGGSTTVTAGGGGPVTAGAGAPADPDLMAGSFVWSPTRQLTWADFRGRPNMMSEAMAQTSYSLSYEANCVGDTFTFRVESLFLPTQSWVKSAHLLDRASDRTLQHERTHFDLSEVQARRARLGLAVIPSPCGLPEDEQDRAMAGFLKDDAGTQARYDRETLHGALSAQQAKWDDQVRRWLRELPK